MPEPWPPRTWVIVVILILRSPERRWGRSPSPARHGGAWSWSSLCSCRFGSAVGVDGVALSGVDAGRRVHRVLLVSRRDRSRCRRRRGCGFSCSSRAPSAVRVDHPTLSGADLRGRVHRRLRSSVGVDAPASAGRELCRGRHRQASVSRWGRCPRLCRPGSCVVVFIARPRSAVGVDAPASAGRELCRGLHRQASRRGWRGAACACSSWAPVQGFGAPLGPSRRRRRRGAGWWSSSGLSAVGVHGAAGGGADAGGRAHRFAPGREVRQPLGSIVPRLPERRPAVVLIGRSAVGVHAAAGAGVDARGHGHRLLRVRVRVCRRGRWCRPRRRGSGSKCSSSAPVRVQGVPLGSIITPWPARSCVFVLIRLPPVSRWGPSPDRRRRGAASSCSSACLRSAVGVHPRAASGAENRVRVHRRAPVRVTVRRSGDHHALAGADVRGGGHRRAPGQGLPLGSM